jgi:hypothetical protein
MICMDEPTPRHYEVAAINARESLARHSVPKDYMVHIYQYTVDDGHVVSWCCIPSDLPESVTEKPHFKEMQWWKP